MKQETFPIFSMINDFESKSYHIPEIKTQHRSLYYFLLGVLMHRRGANRFNMALDYGMSGSKIGNHRTYITTLEELQSHKFLTYTPGKNRFSFPIIELHFCKPTASLLQVYRKSIASNIKAIEAKEALEDNSEGTDVPEKVCPFSLEFEKFRSQYPGTKRGLETEFEHFKKKAGKEWKAILPTLTEKLQSQKNGRAANKEAGKFVPEWKHLKTWINNRSWEEVIELPFQPDSQRNLLRPTPSMTSQDYENLLFERAIA